MKLDPIGDVIQEAEALCQNVKVNTEYDPTGNCKVIRFLAVFDDGGTDTRELAQAVFKNYLVRAVRRHRLDEQLRITSKQDEIRICWQS